MNAVIAAVAAFLSTMLGGALAIRYRGKFHLIASFSAGVLIGGVLF